MRRGKKTDVEGLSSACDCSVFVFVCLFVSFSSSVTPPPTTLLLLSFLPPLPPPPPPPPPQPPLVAQPKQIVRSQ